jgi:acyl-CoA reductase-like NAD-dependent aldehyde dehydrogenase
MQIINPATEEIISEIREDTRETLDTKFGVLKNAQASWENTPLAKRVEVLKRFSNLLEKNIEQLASTLTSEVGKPLQAIKKRSEWCKSKNKMAYRKC